jgi:hypothetical protein
MIRGNLAQKRDGFVRSRETPQMGKYEYCFEGGDSNHSDRINHHQSSSIAENQRIPFIVIQTNNFKCKEKAITKTFTICDMM